jgi:hypothetical protein
VKLRIDFGINGARKEVIWWQALDQFPHALIYEGDRWEWEIFADDPNKLYDKILTFGHMSLGDARWNDCVDFEQRFGHTGSSNCQCGAIHTSFPQFHMFFCPQWRKQ